MAGMFYYCFFFVKVLLCVKIDTLSSYQIKELSDWVVTDWCHPLSESLWVTLLLCWIMINGMGTLSAVDLGSDSKWGKALAMVIPTPQLATIGIGLDPFQSYLPQYLVYVLISVPKWLSTMRKECLGGRCIADVLDLTTTLNRAFSGICWNNQMSIYQVKINRQNYGWCGHIEVKSCQLAAARL
jgi:hypothetical protein